MTPRKFTPTIGIRLLKIIAIIVWFIIVAALIFGSIVTFQDMLSLSESVELLSIFLSINIFLMMFFTMLAISSITTIPVINVNDQGIILETPLGKSRWLPWAAVTKVEKPPFGPSFWFVRVRGLPWYYAINGLLFLGQGHFIIGRSIENHEELLAIMKQKCGDIMNPFK